MCINHMLTSWLALHDNKACVYLCCACGTSHLDHARDVEGERAGGADQQECGNVEEKRSQGVAHPQKGCHVALGNK